MKCFKFLISFFIANNNLMYKFHVVGLLWQKVHVLVFVEVVIMLN